MKKAALRSETTRELDGGADGLGSNRNAKKVNHAIDIKVFTFVRTLKESKTEGPGSPISLALFLGLY